MSSRHLVMIRHGKAVAAAADDASRRLDPRGERDAAAAGGWLASAGLAPDRAVVSPAVRTRQTWALAAASVPGTPAPEFDPRIYDNTLDDLLAVVQETPRAVATLVVVGHNPSVQQLCVFVDDGGVEAAADRRELAGKYPTSGIAVFALDVEWAALGPKAARLRSFTVARG